MAYKIIRPASHDEWLEERKKGIGASDAGTVMGVSPFKTRTKLFMQKTGRLAPDPETPAMREGHWLEFATAAAFEELADAVVDPSTEGDWLAVDTKDEFLRVSPDRCWWPKDTPEKERTKKNWCVLELKSTNKPVDPDSLPMYWILQLQYQMGVMGAKKGALCWIDKSAHAGEPAFGYKMFDFKPNTYKNLKEALTDFWKNHILADVPPSADTGDDVALLYSATDPQKRTVAPQDLQESLTSYKALKAEADRLEMDVPLEHGQGLAEDLVVIESQGRNVFEGEPFGLFGVGIAFDFFRFDQRVEGNGNDPFAGVAADFAEASDFPEVLPSDFQIGFFLKFACGGVNDGFVILHIQEAAGQGPLADFRGFAGLLLGAALDQQHFELLGVVSENHTVGR